MRKYKFYIVLLLLLFLITNQLIMLIQLGIGNLNEQYVELINGFTHNISMILAGVFFGILLTDIKATKKEGI